METMRDPDKYSWWSDEMARIPPRPPRLPRDHFAMRPKLSKFQRRVRDFTVLFAIAACIAYGILHR